MRPVTAYATPGPRAPFQKTTIDRRDLGPKDVLIKIAYTGICHSDIHTARGEWGRVEFPLVPGHEIAGVVEETGDAVTRHAVGDRVGVGCMVDSCRECASCRAGEEQYCTERRDLDLQRLGQGRPAHRRRVLDPHRRRRGLRAGGSRTGSASTRPLPCCARASPCSRRSSVGARARTSRSRSSASAASATWE